MADRGGLMGGEAPSGTRRSLEFVSDPFAGSAAPTTPGRQIVGGEPLVSFSIASDAFAFEPAIFGAGDQERRHPDRGADHVARPRLVYSTDLSDDTADLKVLARITNLAGQSGALASFTASNFAMIPEPPSTLLGMAVYGALGALARRRRRDARR